MSLILKLDLDMVTISLYTQNKVPYSCGSCYSLNRQTDRPNWNYYLSRYIDGKNVAVEGVFFPGSIGIFQTIPFWYYLYFLLVSAMY